MDSYEDFILYFYLVFFLVVFIDNDIPNAIISSKSYYSYLSLHWRSVNLVYQAYLQLCFYKLAAIESLPELVL